MRVRLNHTVVCLWTNIEVECEVELVMVNLRIGCQAPVQIEVALFFYLREGIMEVIELIIEQNRAALV